MTTTDTLQTLGCTAPRNRDLSAEQAVDALEALCDALFRGYRADFRYYVAKTPDFRMECLVEAFDAWNTVKTSISNFQEIRSLPQDLIAAAYQLSRLLHSRLSGTYDPGMDSQLITKAANMLKSDPAHDPRRVELLEDVSAHLLYYREAGLPVPDLSDLLSEL